MLNAHLIFSTYAREWHLVNHELITYKNKVNSSKLWLMINLDHVKEFKIVITRANN